MKYKFVEIKGIPIKIIKIDGKWYYKNHRCDCPCHKRIPYRESQKSHGIPDFIIGHNFGGKTHSPKSKNKMSNSQKNRFENTKERKKMSKALKKYYRDRSNEILIRHMKMMRNARKAPMGSPLSQKTKDKISKLKLELYKVKTNHPRYGKPAPKGAGTGKGCYYNSPLQGRIWLRSSYELKYAKYLDKKGILWKYEKKAFKLSNGTTYTPDFFLTKKKKYREIKGYMTETAQEKIDLFQEEYPDKNFKILYYEDLVKKRIL